MKVIVYFATLLVILGAFNFGIYEKEQTIRDGETVFVELAPTDPRSLLQGDYMRLQYQIAVNIPMNDGQHGHMVIGLDENKVAHFKRFYSEELLAQDERLIKYSVKHGIATIEPSSYMFQEGHAEHYAQAKYGVFKYSKPEKYVLIGLANEKLELIKPENSAAN